MYVLLRFQQETFFLEKFRWFRVRGKNFVYVHL